MICAALVGTLLIVVDQASMHFGLKGSQRVVDDICGGAIVGLLVFWFARMKTQYRAQRSRTIALMNHHVRNALQVIKYAGYIRPEAEQSVQVKDAVQRIEWALREVLPAPIVESEKDWKQPSRSFPG